MAFVFSDHHINEYPPTQGYTVFRQLLPPALVADLRRVCAEARDLARQQRGPQAQRLQPMADFPLDQQPFIDYARTPRHSTTHSTACSRRIFALAGRRSWVCSLNQPSRRGVPTGTATGATICPAWN